MKLTLLRHHSAALLLAVCCSLSGCGQTDEKTDTAQAAATVAVADTLPPARPAPEFFVIPPHVAKTRVWICIDESSDIFHTKHDCPVLVQCKGNFRNMLLVRAVEDFGRYNCQECSQGMDHIYDEELVR